MAKMKTMGLTCGAIIEELQGPHDIPGFVRLKVTDSSGGGFASVDGKTYKTEVWLLMRCGVLPDVIAFLQGYLPTPKKQPKKKRARQTR